jgi:hypothetical protein
MDHVDSHAVAFGCVDQLQRYSNVIDIRAASHSMSVAPNSSVSLTDCNPGSTCGHMMLGTGSVGSCDPVATMHDFSMASASCNVPLGLGPFHSGSGDLSSMLVLSSGLQPASGTFGQPHVNPSPSMYPYLPAGGMQSFLQAASPAQFPFQNFSSIRGSFTGGLNSTTARAFSCFRPMSVGEQNLLLTNTESAHSHVSNYSQPTTALFADVTSSTNLDNVKRQTSVAGRLLVNSGLSVDQTVLNISTFLNLPTCATPAASAEQSSENIGCETRADTMTSIGLTSSASIVGDDHSSSGSPMDKFSPNSRRRRFPAKTCRVNGSCSGLPSSSGSTAFEASRDCIVNQNVATSNVTTLVVSSVCTDNVDDDRMCLDPFVFSANVSNGITAPDYNAHKSLLHGSDFSRDLDSLDGADDVKVDLLVLPENMPSDGNCSVTSDVNIEDHQCVMVDGVRRWRCLECPKVYSTKHNLVTHTLGHRGIKPHRCLTCGKYFKQVL